jgi:hypothetical protein
MSRELVPALESKIYIYRDSGWESFELYELYKKY